MKKINNIFHNYCHYIFLIKYNSKKNFFYIETMIIFFFKFAFHNHRFNFLHNITNEIAYSSSCDNDM